MFHNQGRIVVLTDKRDGHLPFVLRHLDEEPLIIDTGRILQGEHLTYRTIDGALEVVHAGKVIERVKSVWFRAMSSDRILEAHSGLDTVTSSLNEDSQSTALFHRLVRDLLGDPEESFWAEAMPVKEVMRRYVASSLNRLSGALAYAFPHSFWVSPRDAIAKAMHKPIQLAVASKFGLRVPETVITSDPAEAAAFLVRMGECVIKPLALNAPPGLNQYTTVLSASQPPNFSGLHVNPHIFQEVINPKYEARVTVIGSQIFGASVSDTRPDADVSMVRDWRQAFEMESFEASQLIVPSYVVEACHSMVRYYGLECGMFDFIIDKFGRWIFLEINPNGAWGFIEEATGQPIGKAVAELLQRGHM